MILTLRLNAIINGNNDMKFNPQTHLNAIDRSVSFIERSEMQRVAQLTRDPLSRSAGEG